MLVNVVAVHNEYRVPIPRGGNVALTKAELAETLREEHGPPSPSISRSVAQEIPLTKVHTRFLRHSAPFPNATSSIKDTAAPTLMRSTRACEPPPGRLTLNHICRR